MAGAAPPHVGELIRELRAELGPEVALIGSVGFDAFPSLIDAAGAAATGMYVTRYGIPNSKLPPAGRRFLRQFEAAGGGPSPDQSPRTARRRRRSSSTRSPAPTARGRR